VDNRAGPHDLHDPQARVRDDDIGPAAGLEGADLRVTGDSRGCGGCGPDRIHQRHSTRDGRPHDVEQVGRAACDGPTFAELGLHLVADE
jgi:hypothetical protein